MLCLDWYVSGITNDTISIQLLFNNTAYVSSDPNSLDYLVVQVLKPWLFLSKNNKLTIAPPYTTQVTLPNQQNLGVLT